MTDRSQLHLSRPWWALAVAMVSLALAGGLLVTSMDSASSGPGSTDEQSAMLAVAPGGSAELASLPAAHQEIYRAAAADPAGFEAVTCYCGCEAFLDHRHLLDCFVRPDGGWEGHATGCGVCLAEARDVIDLRATDTPIDEVTRRIDDRYSAITASTT